MTVVHRSEQPKKWTKILGLQCKRYNSALASFGISFSRVVCTVRTELLLADKDLRDVGPKVATS